MSNVCQAFAEYIFLWGQNVIWETIGIVGRGENEKLNKACKDLLTVESHPCIIPHDELKMRKPTLDINYFLLQGLGCECKGKLCTTLPQFLSELPYNLAKNNLH